MEFMQIQSIIWDTSCSNIQEVLTRRGVGAAEQNHSSVAAYLGDGAAWTVLVENIAQLLKRHKDILRRHMVAEDHLYLCIHVYKTTYQGYKGLSDMEAKKSLSVNAHK
jgi:hypothetical protein